MSYQTAKSAHQASLVIKKSEFLAFAYPIETREQALWHVQDLRQRYPDARHHCWAYILGDPHNTTSAGFDDDGEPSGTAGRPILNVLQHKAIGNLVIVVVRYFGGIKLGAGGLTRAYSSAVQGVIEGLELVPYVAKVQCRVESDFANEAQIRHLVECLDGQILAVEYGKKVILQISLAQADLLKFEERLGIWGKIVD